MRGKTAWISLLMALILIGGIPGALGAFVAGDTETVKVRLIDATGAESATVTYPDGQEYVELNDTYYVSPYGPDTFTVWLNVTDVTELRLYGAGVSWDSSILSLEDYGEGEFFYRAPAEYRTKTVNLPVLADGSGYIDKYAQAAWALEKPGNVSGTGTLAWFDFKVVGWGFTYIDILIGGSVMTVLQDPLDNDIDWNTYDIVFDNMAIAPPGYGPTADGSVAPPAPWFVDQVLTFTGKNTSTEWGFSGAPLFLYYPIVLFEWDFDDTNFDTGISVTHAFTSDGTYNVNLTVTDSNGGKDWTIIPVTIFPLAEGAVLDVMTNGAYNGSGAFWPASPYRANKEEEVILYAKVIYNNCPVVNKLVTFTVYQHTPPPEDPYALAFSLRLVRTAFTNTSGWASISYNIPTGWENEFHGPYLVYAYCFIDQDIPDPPATTIGLVADATIYHVEWVNEITSVVALPPGTWEQLETAMFNITIQSWDYVALPIVISLTLYDDLDCVIAATSCGPAGRPPSLPAPCDFWSPTRTFYGDNTYLGLIADLYIPPATAWFVMGAAIPRHAYVGVGTAYVNLHDAWPMPDMFALPLGLTGDGQPYCPEMSAPFGIECAS